MKIFKYYATILIFVSILLIGLLRGQNIDCVGNSITANGYPEIVDFWMDADGYDWKVFNYGVPGITVSIPGFDFINTPEYKEVMSRKSEHIVVMLGANDRKAVAIHGTVNFEKEYRYLINKFRSISKKVFLGTATYQIHAGQNSTTDAMNTVIRKIAKSYNLPIIDFNAALGTDPANFRSDGVHPTSKGKMKLARLAFNILKTYPIYCTDINWQPKPDVIEEGIEFIQTSNCGNTRQNIGTKMIMLGIEDDEYRDAVERDKKDNRRSGCSFRNPTKSE